MLKRILAIVLLAGAALFILSSSSSTPNYKAEKTYMKDEWIVEDVNMAVNSYYYEDGKFYFNLTIDNNTGRIFYINEYGYTGYRGIEFKNTDGQWYAYDSLVSYIGFSMLMPIYCSEPNTSSDLSEFPIDWPYSKFSKGEYRILIAVNEIDEEGRSVNFEQPQYFADEFEVK